MAAILSESDLSGSDDKISDLNSTLSSLVQNSNPMWKQGMFVHRIPKLFQLVSKLWLLCRGVMLWSVWSERSDATFNDNRWLEQKLERSFG